MRTGKKRPRTGYGAGRGRSIRQYMRGRIKRLGFKRPMAIIRARRAVAGKVMRGDWISMMLDLNRDAHEETGTLDTCWDWYGEFIMNEEENG